MKYQAYPDYKDSGSQWLGSIPSQWIIFDGKRIFNKRSELALDEDEQLAASQKYGVIPQSLMMQLNDTKVMLALKGTSSFRHVDKNDFVISLRSFEGGIEHSDYKGCVSPAYTVLNASKIISPRFYRYLFKSNPFIAALQSTTDSLRDGKSITYEQFGAIPLVFPTTDEQENIANFLDHETTKIDTLIVKQQQLIKLLKEKRQAVISHAVTKGLNPNAPMRDSGVEWLGEVPEHWEIPKIGHCAFVTKLTGFEYTNLWRTSEDGEIIALRGFNVKDGKLDLYKAERISVDLSKKLARSKLSKGDIVFPCTGTIGNAALIENDDKFHINQNIAKISFEGKVSPKFAVYWLTSSFVRTLIDRNNMSGMQPVVLIGDIRKLPIPGMSLEEQDLITGYLDIQISKFNKIIGSGEQAIELMQERRAALISAAVTGKIDVRDWNGDST